jgi:uncharacterized protein (DUF983 family)
MNEQNLCSDKAEFQSPKLYNKSEMIQQRCNNCSQMKLTSQFAKNQYYCRDCNAKFAKVIRKNRRINKDYTQLEKLICYKCKLEKSIENFNRDRGTATGFKSLCKSCRSDYYFTRKNLVVKTLKT